MPSLTIGALAAAAGVKVPTIRYYESIGLMPPAARTDANRRSFGDADVARLRLIRHARDLGFDIDAIRHLLDLAGQPGRPCGEVDALADRHLAAIDAKMAALAALRAEVAHMVAACSGGTVGECRVLGGLADHGLCAAPHRRA